MERRRTRSLDYFYNTIIEVFRIKGKVLGKLDCQKTIYFAKRLGAPVPFGFRWNILGPYSYELAHTCDFLIIEGLVSYTGEYKLNEKSESDFVSRMESKTASKLKEFFDCLTEICNSRGYNPVTFIECAASLDFIQANVREELRKKERAFALLDELKPEKRFKFKEMKDDAWRLLVKERLVS